MPDKTFTSAMFTSADMNTYGSHTGDAWVTWTPTMQQAGVVASTVNHAVRYRAGRLIEVSFRLTVTGSGSGTFAVQVSLPITAARSQGVIGHGVIYDSSANLSYAGTAELNSTTTFVFSGMGLGVSPNSLGTTGSAFTAGLASGDVVTGTLKYESAS